ncbi:MAG: flagellar motor protein MotB [Candidatus Paceibacteria bacterium]|jgi:flagellar motor protein MotB
MGDFKPSPKPAPPAYMVSFCDMMTLILTFFILLVSMSKERKAGLAAAGVGSFVIAVKSHGLPGVLSGQEEMAIFEHTRRKFNVPQDEDPDRMTDVVDASNLELIKTKLLDALQPHDEMTHPSVLEFPEGSAVIPEGAKKYLRELAPSLQPKFRQTLHVEGHANDSKAGTARGNRLLALARATALRDYLIEEYGFAPDRVQARAWLVELPNAGQNNRAVDIRLVTPGPKSADK